VQLPGLRRDAGGTPVLVGNRATGVLQIVKTKEFSAGALKSPTEPHNVLKVKDCGLPPKRKGGETGRGRGVREMKTRLLDEVRRSQGDGKKSKMLTRGITAIPEIRATHGRLGRQKEGHRWKRARESGARQTTSPGSKELAEKKT